MHQYVWSEFLVRGKEIGQWPWKKKFGENSRRTRICFGEELDEALCINYQPGMLAEIEDALNEERDRAVAEQFFSEGCAT